MPTLCRVTAQGKESGVAALPIALIQTLPNFVFGWYRGWVRKRTATPLDFETRYGDSPTMRVALGRLGEQKAGVSAEEAYAAFRNACLLWVIGLYWGHHISASLTAEDSQMSRLLCLLSDAADWLLLPGVSSASPSAQSGPLPTFRNPERKFALEDLRWLLEPCEFSASLTFSSVPLLMCQQRMRQLTSVNLNKVIRGLPPAARSSYEHLVEVLGQTIDIFTTLWMTFA